MAKKSFSSSLLVAILSLTICFHLVSATEVGISPYGPEETNPVCTNPTSLTVTAEDLLSEEEQEQFVWDHSTFYFDYTLNGQSMPIYVINAKDQNDYQIITYADKTLTTRRTATCTDSSQLVFVKLIDNVLILKNPSGDTFSVCIVSITSWSESITVQTLASPAGTPDLTGPITGFIPYFFREDMLLNVAYTSATQTIVVSYDLASDQSPLSYAKDATFPNQVPTQVYGNSQWVYLVPQKKFFSVASQTQINMVSIQAYQELWFHDMTGSISLLVVLTNVEKTQAIVYGFSQMMVQAANFDSSGIHASTDPLKQWSDQVNNLVIQGSFGLWWLHLQVITNIAIDYTVTSTYLADKGTIENIALSGNKMVILTDSQIIYLKIESDQVVKEVYRSQLSEISSFDPTQESYSYALTLSCTCQSVKKFVCMSSTLNCIIIKKAQQGCATPDNFYQPQD